MFAKCRLYLTADRDALVVEGDERGAYLYVAPGDEIPESAVKRFGLVDGGLPVAILRVAYIGEGLSRLLVAGLAFQRDFRTFAAGDIDIAQLLDILREPDLAVEAMQFDLDDRALDWAPMPGRDLAIEGLTRAVAAITADGGPMPRLGEAMPADLDLGGSPIDAAAPANAALPADIDPPADLVTGDVVTTAQTITGDPVPPVMPETLETPVKEAEDAADKEKPVPANKEAKRGANKGAQDKAG